MVTDNVHRFWGKLNDEEFLQLLNRLRNFWETSGIYGEGNQVSY